jgi:hypothetical protein
LFDWSQSGNLSSLVIDGRALLDPTDVQGGRSEVHLPPAEVHQLGYPEAVPVSHEDHSGVPVAPSVPLGRFHEPLDLGLGEVLPPSKFGMGTPRGRNCSF